ncbi:transglycosylase SLT domain-containing protein, partial [Kineococcus sp. R8]|uniref:lytic transglycosylase domain-containing protein n=1 Tax=Kineococcus siccus TaxID=2696567 RepID=UPI001411DFC6
VQATRLEDALSAAQARLDALSERATRLRAAEDAARALAQARANAAALARTADDAASEVPARRVPVDYAALYAAAAATCPGMRTALLSAVGQVESGHGRDVGPSSAGARGPMQFMPATFAAYAVDGDRDGDTDVLDPTDAVHTAAAYLCANGGGRGRAGEAGALYRYNHAQWYVAMVQRLADQLDTAGSPA